MGNAASQGQCGQPAGRCHRASTGTGAAADRGNGPVRGASYAAITLLMVNTGSSSARATPPMIRPMTMIMIGSI